MCDDREPKRAVIVGLAGAAAAARSSIGLGVIVTFGSPFFATRGWTPVWLAFTAYAVALIGARLGRERKVVSMPRS